MLSQKYPEICDIISGQCHPPLVCSLISWSMNIAQQQMQTHSPVLLSNTTQHSYTVHSQLCARKTGYWQKLGYKKKKKSQLTPSTPCPQYRNVHTANECTCPHIHAQYSCCVSNPQRPELWEQGECSLARHNGVSHSRQNLETHASKERLISGKKDWGTSDSSLLFPPSNSRSITSGTPWKWTIASSHIVYDIPKSWNLLQNTLEWDW